MAITKRGSQTREPIADTSLTPVFYSHATGELVVYNGEEHRYELYMSKDDYAGYVLEFFGYGFEFCASAKDWQRLVSDDISRKLAGYKK